MQLVLQSKTTAISGAFKYVLQCRSTLQQSLASIVD